MRLDQYLVQQGLLSSRNKAKEAIMKGLVYVNGHVAKASTIVSEQDKILVEDVSMDVSRSAEKLREALRVFELSLEGKTILDLGQSTGGFTQVALEAGASQVIGLDVGHHQLHPTLASNPKVTSYEGINIKEIAQLEVSSIDFIVCDLSFISSLSVLSHITSPANQGLLLLKPQFETQGQHLTKGRITDPAVLDMVLAKTASAFSDLGLCVKGVHPCSTKGKEGNQEFMVWFSEC